MGFAAQGYERALLRLEAALDLALSGGEALRELDAARAELGTDSAWTRALAERIAADPDLSRTSQRAPANLALKRLLND